MTQITSCIVSDGSVVGYPLVTVQVIAEDATEIAFSNDGATWSDWRAYSGNHYEWLLLPGDGARIVRVRVRNGSGGSATAQASVTVNSVDATDGLLDNLPAIYSRARAGLLWELFNAASTELSYFKRAMSVGLDQLNVQRARESWLNMWGRLLGVSRRTGESDADYAPRIIRRITSAKLAPASVRDALEDELGGTEVTVSDLEGYDGFLLIQVHGTVADMPALWSRIREVKAAGVKAVVLTE